MVGVMLDFIINSMTPTIGRAQRARNQDLKLPSLHLLPVRLSLWRDSPCGERGFFTAPASRRCKKLALFASCATALQVVWSSCFYRPCTDSIKSGVVPGSQKSVYKQN